MFVTLVTEKFNPAGDKLDHKFCHFSSGFSFLFYLGFLSKFYLHWNTNEQIPLKN